MHHVTFRRKADSLRVVIVLPAELSKGEAIRQAELMKPEAAGVNPRYGFERVAYREHDGSPWQVPLDAEHWDRYGERAAPEDVKRWQAEFASAIAKMAPIDECEGSPVSSGPFGV